LALVAESPAVGPASQLLLRSGATSITCYNWIHLDRKEFSMTDSHDAPSSAPSGKYMSSVKVGPKGQIVIPKEARTMFGIVPGDSLLLLADIERGIAIQRLDHFDRIADEI